MGPRHYSRGNLIINNYIIANHMVSMGPRHYSRGNLNKDLPNLMLIILVSMGPRHYSRGNKECGKRFQIELDGFNGATTLQSWKQIQDPFTGKKIWMFQWGHDITVVETLEQLLIYQYLLLVSMGPRHYSRGNFYISNTKFNKEYQFQWGHDITVVETEMRMYER